MMEYGAGLGFGLGGLLALIGLVLLGVGAVLLVAWAIGRLGAGTPASSTAVLRPPVGDAVDVLRLRFAKGEITRDEYLAAKQTLESEG